MPTLVREPSPLSTMPPRIPRPAALTEGRWAASRLDQGDLGPSMLEVVIWYPPGSQAAMESALGPASAPATVTMDRRAVAALVPELVSAEAIAADSDLQELTGPCHPGKVFEGGGFFGARVVQVAGGVLVAVRTGG